MGLDPWSKRRALECGFEVNSGRMAFRHFVKLDLPRRVGKLDGSGKDIADVGVLEGDDDKNEGDIWC